MFHNSFFSFFPGGHFVGYADCVVDVLEEAQVVVDQVQEDCLHAQEVRLNLDKNAAPRGEKKMAEENRGKKHFRFDSLFFEYLSSAAVNL